MVYLSATHFPPIGGNRTPCGSLVHEKEGNMAQGTVKWFSNEKGYGFISQEGGDDLFVHHSEIKMQGYRTLNEGEVVTFEVGEGKNGKPQAINVERM